MKTFKFIFFAVICTALAWSCSDDKVEPETYPPPLVEGVDPPRPPTLAGSLEGKYNVDVTVFLNDDLFSRITPVGLYIQGLGDNEIQIRFKSYLNDKISSYYSDEISLSGDADNLTIKKQKTWIGFSLEEGEIIEDDNATVEGWMEFVRRVDLRTQPPYSIYKGEWIINVQNEDDGNKYELVIQFTERAP